MICTIILFLICNNRILAQESSIDTALLSVFSKSQESHFEKLVQKDAKDAVSVFSLLFIAYKKYISSQDVPSCVFEPSCSVYSLQSVQRMGVIKGILNTFDRLTRCNAFSPENYSRDIKTGLFYDPVE